MDPENEIYWRKMLIEGVPAFDKPKAIFKALPDSPRCTACYAPFESLGGQLMRLIGKAQSSLDPRFCQSCERGMREHPGGTYVDLAMVFADVRGSTPLAERLGDVEFSRLINRFYTASAEALIGASALIDRLAGDEAIGFFAPGVAGMDFPRKAIEGAKQLLRATGHGAGGDPWVPVGVGAHVGHAYMGMVGSRYGRSDFTALGDDVNVGARIAGAAGPGELLASLEICRQAGIETESLERRSLSLKGKSKPMLVAVLPLD